MVIWEIQGSLLDSICILKFISLIGLLDKRYAVDPLQYLNSLGNPANNPYDGTFGTLKVNYPAGYGVNVYNAPNGSYKGKVYGGESYKVYAEKDGWYDLGNSTWVKGEHVIIIK